MNKRIRATALEKVPTGFGLVDQLTGGGLPARRVTLITGAPGSGKTSFALQTLLHAAQRGEAGVFITFNENPRHVVENAASFGWDLPELEKNYLAVLDGRPRAGRSNEDSFDVTGLLGGLRAVSSEVNAKLVVFDSIDVMLALVSDGAPALRELFRIRDWLSNNGMTAILTVSGVSGASPSIRPQEFLQLISDCSLTLDLQRNANEVSRCLRVDKYRGSAFQHQELPFVISGAGLEFASPQQPSGAVPSLQAASGFRTEIEFARRQLSQRVQDLDRFLEMKQAELDFLFEKQPSGRARGGSARRKPARRSPQTLSGEV